MRQTVNISAPACYCYIMLNQHTQFFVPAPAPFGTAGEYFCSNYSKFRQKINQNVYVFRQKYENFRARLRSAIIYFHIDL